MVIKFETLGDIVAFKKTDVYVLSSLYNAVPEEFQDDFEQVLVNSMSAYYLLVNEAKARGDKISAATFKKQVIENMINPFLDTHNLTNYQKSRINIIRPKNPSIPIEKKVTVERRSPIVETVDTSDVADVFDNYNWDEEVVVAAPEISQPLDSSDFGFGKLFDDDDGFDLDSLGL